MRLSLYRNDGNSDVVAVPDIFLPSCELNSAGTLHFLGTAMVPEQEIPCFVRDDLDRNTFVVLTGEDARWIQSLLPLLARLRDSRATRHDDRSRVGAARASNPRQDTARLIFGC